MKKPIFILLSVLCLVSCDFMLKDTHDDEKNTNTLSDKKVVLGTDKDKNGCVTSAGYRWSKITEECIRPVEEGFRLNTIDQIEGESDVTSAFIIFEEDGDRAELFLPNNTESQLLKKESKNGPYKNNRWSLQSQKGYRLKRDGQLIYVGAAAVQENQVTGDYKEES
jgi:hypothetical protein